MRAGGEKRWIVLAVAFGVAVACGGKIQPEPVGSTDAPPSSTPPPPAGPPDEQPHGPHQVACGDTWCEVPADTCCSTSGNMACFAPDTGAECPGATIECDQPADCPPALPVCCWIPRKGGDGWSSQCADSCARGVSTFEACATDSDCKEQPGPCTTHTCGGRTYRFCQAVTQLCSP